MRETVQEVVKILVLAVAPDVVVHARMVAMVVVVVVDVLLHVQLDVLHVMRAVDVVDARVVVVAIVWVMLCQFKRLLIKLRVLNN